MRKFFFLILAVFTVIGAFSGVTAAEDKTAGKVIAYYFHGKFRCATCAGMGRFTREAIETNFKDDLLAGKIEFKAVDVEEKGNEHFVEDYGLYTKSLVLSLVEGDKEVRSKNLEKIWEYAHNKKKFIDYVAGEIDAFMKDAR